MSFGVSDYIGDGVSLFLSEDSWPDSRVDSEDFANEEAEPSADSFDLLKSEGYCPLSVDVGIQNTMDVLEVVLGVVDD